MKDKVEPLKITVKFYNKKVTTEVDHSDISLEELHDLWIDIIKCMGYHSKTIEEFYE